MKQFLFPRIFLVLAGLIGFSVGVGQLFFPIGFEASSGVSLDADINLLSEFRSAGGSLFLLGIAIIYGAFRRFLLKYALFLASVLYLGYGLARVYAFVVDGIPNELFVIVTTAEVVIGLVALFMFYRIRKTVRNA